MMRMAFSILFEAGILLRDDEFKKETLTVFLIY